MLLCWTMLNFICLIPVVCTIAETNYALHATQTSQRGFGKGKWLECDSGRHVIRTCIVCVFVIMYSNWSCGVWGALACHHAISQKKVWRGSRPAQLESCQCYQRLGFHTHLVLESFGQLARWAQNSVCSHFCSSVASSHIFILYFVIIITFKWT